MQTRSAYTMLEMVMSMSILATVFAMTMESLSSMNNFMQASNGRYTLQDEARRTLQAIQDHLGASAWFIPSDPISDPEEHQDILNSLKGLDAEGEEVPYEDRELQYYPFVLAQTGGGRGVSFSHWARSSGDLTHPLSWDEAELDQYSLPSHEIVFVKVATGDSVDDPKQLQGRHANFGTEAVALSDFTSAPILDSMVLTETFDDATLRFERDTQERLREYSIVVVPGTDGRNELQVRHCHRDQNGAGSITVSETLSHNVERIVFDTSRTHATLEPDQVRVTIYFKRVEQSGLVQRLVASLTCAMRSTVDPAYSRNIDNNLGRPGQFPIVY